MQELLRRSLSGAVLLMTVWSLAAQVTEKEAISNYRFDRTLSGQYVATIPVADVHQLSTYLADHEGIELLQYADGNATIILDNDPRLSNSYFLQNLTKHTKTTTPSKFTSILQSQLETIEPTASIDVVFTLYKDQHVDALVSYIEFQGIATVADIFGKSIQVNAESAAIRKIAALAEIANVDLLDEAVQPLNYEVRILQRNSLLHTATNLGGYGLTGAGVTIGIGDGGELGQHLDFGSRVINQADGTYSSFGAHGDHVAGILGASGALNPRNKGVAPGSNIITQKTTQIIAHAEDYYDSYGMSLTNNSYGVSFNCSTNGTYNYNSINLDYLTRMNPKMLHIFAAGNNGTRSCEGYPAGYNTILRNYQSAKNVITVGAVGDNREIASISARGPVADGRIKPEVVANGMNIISTGRDYNYFSNNGTSMAAPALTGTLALLSEQYEKINGEAPDGGLLKAIACNTADDLGNEGPDYTFGFGMVNARRAVEAVLDGRHAQGRIQNGNNSIHLLQVPTNVSEVKVMLYWHDMEGANDATKALVNDLDLKVLDNNQVLHQPWVLNTDPASVNAPATKGVDDINNIEQVSIKNPSAGTYRITIDGSKVPYDEQQYYLVYEFIYSDVDLTYPIGGEVFTPNKYELISWDAEADNTSEFKISYSINDGASWITLVDNISAADRSYAWNVPADVVESARIKIEKKDGSSVDQSQPFRIRESFTSFEVSPICEGMTAVSWEFSNDAHYNTSILLLDDENEIELDVSMNNDFIYETSLPSGQMKWFAVDFADQQGNHGSRSIAKSVIPSYEATCPWTDDVKLSADPVRFTGRLGTSRDLLTIQLPIEIKNIGANAQTGLSIQYNLNGLQEKTISRVIESGDTYTYNFIETVRDLPVGIQEISVLTPADRTANNSLNSIIALEMLANEPIALPFALNLSSVDNQVYTQSEIGLTDLDRWDFIQAGNGQLRIEQHAGSDALLLVSVAEAEVNELTVTLNLANEIVATPLFLNMDYLKSSSGSASIEIRGDDQSPWIPVTNTYMVVDWAELVAVPISQLLADQNQQYSSSTQIRFVQDGVGSIALRNLSIDVAHGGVATTVPYQNTLSYTNSNSQYYLNWLNNSEDVGYVFEIQYATDSMALINDEYEVLTTVDGFGVNAAGWNYQQLIENLPGGFDYYFRVKTIDVDQPVGYSNIIKISLPLSTGGGTLVDIDKLDLRLQNIVTSDLNYALDVPTRLKINVRLLNAVGAVVHQESNTYDVGTHDLVISGSALSQKGLYFLEVTSAAQQITEKVVAK